MPKEARFATFKGRTVELDAHHSLVAFTVGTAQEPAAVCGVLNAAVKRRCRLYAAVVLAGAAADLERNATYDVEHLRRWAKRLEAGQDFTPEVPPARPDP